MRLKGIARVLISSLLLLSFANICLAGFGVSPPWVKNHVLLPGSRFEQTIILSRGEPEESLKAKVTIDVPEEIRSWFSIDKGLEFVLPKGEQQVPMKVTVNVPKNAKLGKYTGAIMVETFPEKEGGTVSVALAAGIDIDLEVTEKEIAGMIIRFTDIGKIEEGSPLKYLMRIENTGNVNTKPDRVYIEVFDQAHQSLLASGENKNLDWVGPFQTKEIAAEFPTIKLGIGQYWAEIKIFKEDQILREEKLVYEVIEKKPSPSPYSYFGRLSNYYSYIGAGILFLIIFGLLVWAERKRQSLLTPSRVKTRKRKKPELKSEPKEQSK